MLGISLDYQDYVSRLKEELDRIDAHEVKAFSDELYDAWAARRTVFLCGNGGSGSNATHMCEDLAKSTQQTSLLRADSVPRMRALSLTDNTSWITAIGNDLAFDEIFVQQLRTFASPGDLLVAISGSGNSPNILKAVDWANSNGLRTFGITGYDGGKLRSLAQRGMHAPVMDMGMTESLHLTVFHWALNDVYARINREGRHA